MRENTPKYDLIIFDLDNTMTKLQPTLDMISDYFNKEKISEAEIKSFNLTDSFGIAPDEEKDFWSQESEVVINSVYAKERIDRIKEIFAHKHTTYIIVTNRHNALRSLTEQWLDKNQIVYDRLECIGKQDKAKWIIENIKTDNNMEKIVFEDNPSFFESPAYAKLCNEYYTAVIKYPYNEHIQKSDDYYVDYAIDA